jgi:membrane protein implicated in regulation of membrane protease activity
MRFDQKDIEAIAVSRINQIENKRSMQWFGAAALVILASAVLLTKTSQAIGFGVLIVGFAIFLYRMYQMNGKQKIAKEQLVKQWRAEQGANQ